MLTRLAVVLRAFRRRFLTSVPHIEMCRVMTVWRYVIGPRIFLSSWLCLIPNYHHCWYLSKEYEWSFLEHLEQDQHENLHPPLIPPTRSTRSPCRALADGGPWYRLTKALRRGTPGSSESAWEKILGKPPLNSSNREMWKFTNCWKRMVNLRGKKTEKCVCIYIRITWIFHSYIILLFRV